MSLDAFRPVNSPRLRIRKVDAADLEDLLLVNGDDRVTRYLPYSSWRNLEDGQAWLQRMNNFMAEGNTLQLVICEAQSGRVIGTCIIFRYDGESRRAELGYVMAHSHWRSGYTYEALQALLMHAFSDLRLRRIEAEVEPDNVASNNLLLKLGFTREGLLRQRWHGNGQHYDTNIYGLLSHEWTFPESHG